MVKMSGKLLLLAFALLLRVDGFKFYIAKNLDNAEDLDEPYWSTVEIRNCSENIVSLSVDIPSFLSSSCSSIKVFFANEMKQILEIDLNEKIRGKFHGIPYRVEKTMEGPVTHNETTGDFFRISGEFPGAWLPKDCTRVSATVAENTGVYYNYYGIKNYKISIPDLLVVEEYKKYSCDL